MFFWNMVQMILVNTYIIEMCWDPTLDHKQYVLECVGDILKYVRGLEEKDERRKSPANSHRTGRMEGRHFPVKIGLREGGERKFERDKNEQLKPAKEQSTSATPNCRLAQKKSQLLLRHPGGVEKKRESNRR